ncbi:MAG: glycine cleavage system protein H [Deltaproteobacteria bacterium]|nr:glycine cleavage system protein H [Deltaproteobacteria bacterium]
MESFSYVDIFATKGIEYIIVMAFLGGFIYFSRYLAHRGKEAAAEGRNLGVIDYFRVPDGYLFHQGHGWLRTEPGSVAIVGMDDFAQKLIGKVDSIELPEVGFRLSQGEPGWSLISESRRVPMLSPVEGVVVAVNHDVLRSPDLLKQDPYGRGWLFRVRAGKLSRDSSNLLSGKLARSWMKNALDRLQPASTENIGPVLADGGTPIEGIAKAFGGERWDELARKHLLTNGE